jgi:DNA polymerase III delta prime subunit
MRKSYIYKYKPKRLSDFVLPSDLIDTLRLLIRLDTLNLLLYGNTNIGKTSLLDTIIREYYKVDIIPRENVLYINSLEDQGISYYRNEVKTFCQTPSTISGKKKFIVIDDIDNISEQCQQAFRNCIDKYDKLVHFISSCKNLQKVAESIQSRCTIIKITPLCKKGLKKIMQRIITIEKIKITPDAYDFIINVSNNSIRVLINYMEKFNLYDKEITLDVAKNICTNMNFIDFEIYTNHLIGGNFKSAMNVIINNLDMGYSVIDILENYYMYVKHSVLISEEYKYEIVIIISKYIAIFYSKHEDDIELYFLTHEFINLLKNT